MPYSFIGVGSQVAVLAGNAVTPSLPTGHSLNDLLVWNGDDHGHSNDLAIPAGWLEIFFNVNSGHKFRRIALKVDNGAEVAPTTTAIGNTVAQIACFRGGPTDLTGIVDSSAAANGSSVNSVIIPSLAAPANSNCLMLAVGIYEGSYVSYLSSPAAFIDIDHYNAAGNGQSLMWGYQIQTTPTAIASDQWTFGVGGSRSYDGGVIALIQAINAQPVGENSTEPNPLAKRTKPELHQFWQVSAEIRAVPPTSPPPSIFVWPDFISRVKSNVQLGIEQAIPRSLLNTDRVLTPVDWNYGWDKPVLPAALQYSGRGFDASDMTTLTTYVPYSEYNWIVPQGAKQWNRGFEASVNLNLIGQDKVLTAGPNNLQWDPPKGKAFPLSLRGMEQSGLSLFYTVQIPPPGNQWTDLPPKKALQLRQDYIQSLSESILFYATVFPPFIASLDLPPRAKPYPAALRSYDQSGRALLLGQDVIPFGTKFDAPNPIRTRFNGKVLSIEETTQFLVPTTSPVLSGAAGVKHVGRLILDPAKVGEAVNVPFDFISGCAPGETVVSATTTATLYSGVDSNPQALVVGAATASGTIAFQQVIPTITGNVYDLKCTAITSLDQILSLEGYFAIIPGLP